MRFNILASRSALLITLALFFDSTTNSLKKGDANFILKAGFLVISSAAKWAFDMHWEETSLIPSLPSQLRYIVAEVAQSASFEQILEVAFSRLICCSLVCSVRVNALLPSLSTVSP